MANGYEPWKDREMRFYDPNELPKLMSKAADIANKNKSPAASFELMNIVQEFARRLDEFNVQYGEDEPFRFKIEPIRFDGDKKNGKRQDR